jgi:ATP-dependent DNA helicase PIF1
MIFVVFCSSYIVFFFMSTSFTLNEEQQCLLTLATQWDRPSMFITGGAGTGKSSLLRVLIPRLGNHTYVTASTGMAGMQLNAGTLHNWTGLQLCEDSKEVLWQRLQQHNKKFDLQRWRDTHTLVIDEISMIKASLFAKLEWIARQVQTDTFKASLPFGGIQVIACGDFLQLPPVEKNASREENEEAESPLWTCDAWKRTIGDRQFELKHVFRQENDPEFLSLLYSLRQGECSDEQEALLQQTSTRDMSATQKEEDEVKPLVQMFATHGEVDCVNHNALEQLPDDEVVDYQLDEYARPNCQFILSAMRNALLVQNNLQLRIGARVMCVVNVRDKDWINGMCGTVVKFAETSPYFPYVQWDCRPSDAAPECIDWYTWKRLGDRKHNSNKRKFSCQSDNGGDQDEASRVVLAAVTHLPLIHAWAITIHKCQGMTLDRMRVDCIRAFAAGHLYVAISRVRSLQHAQILNFFKGLIKTDPAAREYYAKEVRSVDVWQREQESKSINWDDPSLVLLPPPPPPPPHPTT